MLGTAEAYRSGHFKPLPALLCAAFALLIQIATNFANDYYDYLKGADNEQRIGPTRAVAAGLIKPAQMRNVMVATFVAAFIIGLGLVPFGGPWLIGVGVASILCGIAYTGGPFPIAYIGLGEVFVFLFFGVVAVNFTYYLQAGVFALNPLLLSIGCGALSSNLLVVNNVRDIKTDREANKKTLPARFGKTFGVYEYQAFQMMAWLAFVIIYTRLQNYVALLPCLLYPIARLALTRMISAETGSQYNRTLELTALILISYGVLGSIALCLAPAWQP